MVALWSWLGRDGDASDVDISLEVADEVGRTDLELTAADTKVVIETKKGWLVPGDQQLAAYVARVTSQRAAEILGVNVARLNQLVAKGMRRGFRVRRSRRASSRGTPRR